MNRINNSKQILIVVFLLVLLAAIFYHNIILLPPSYIHIWTQSDRYALCLNFLENGFDITKPQTYNLATTNGITGVDLPIHEYVVAFVMKMVGSKEPFIFRLYTLIISIIGYVYLYKIVFKLSNSNYKALSVVLFVFSLPIVAYYQAGFLPSTTSFAFTFIAYYYYFIFKDNKAFKYLIASLFFMLIAVLSRMPFNIFLFAMLVQELLSDYKGKSFSTKKYFLFTITYVIIIAYLFYKQYLNNKYGSQFLTKMLPASGLSDFYTISKEVIKRWFFQLFTIPHYIFIIIVLMFFFISKKQQAISYVKQQATILIFGSVLYYVLMAKQFVEHEYYFIDSFYIGFTLLFIYIIVSIDTARSIRFRYVYLVLLLCCFIATYKKQEKRYTYTFANKAEQSRKNFENGNLFLDSIGIAKSSKLLVLEAFSTNMPFIQLQRRGYTSVHSTKDSLKSALGLPYDYVIVQDIALPSEILQAYPEFMEKMERVNGNGKFSIFKKNESNKKSTIYDLLGIRKTALKTTIYNLKNYDTLLWCNILTTSNKNDSTLHGIINTINEFGPTLVIKHNTKYKNLLFEFSYKTNESFNGITIATTITSNGKNDYYDNYVLQHVDKNIWKKYQCLFQLKECIGEQELRLYFHNLYKNELLYDSIGVVLY